MYGFEYSLFIPEKRSHLIVRGVPVKRNVSIDYTHYQDEKREKKLYPSYTLDSIIKIGWIAF